MPRILYWAYRLTSYDRHGDAQVAGETWYDSEAEARHDAAAHAADLEVLRHTDIRVQVLPTYGAEPATAGTVRTWE